MNFTDYKARVVEMVKRNEISRLSPQEFVSLFWLNLKVKAQNSVEFLKDVYRYYGTWNFLKADLSLHLMYLFHNPYRISKRFLEKREASDLDTYGETSLTSFEQIADASQITKNDTVYELGCGRGQVCFWLNAMKGCSVVGVEHNPEFVDRAMRIVKRLGIQGLSFVTSDICDVALKGATVCYLYGTCLDDQTIHKMIAKFSKLPAGTRIITVSFPLSDYAKTNLFELMHTFSVPYTWGCADVYIQVKK